MDLETGFYYYDGPHFVSFIKKHTDFSNSEIDQIYQMHCKHKKAVVFKVPSSVSGKIWLEVSTPAQTYESTKPFYPQTSAENYGLIKVFDLKYAANRKINGDPCSVPSLHLNKDERIELIRVEFSNIDGSDGCGFWGVKSIKKLDGTYIKNKSSYWCMLNNGQIQNDFYSVDAVSKYPGVVEQEPSCSEGKTAKFVTVTYDVPPVIKVHESADDLVDYIAEDPSRSINVYDSKYNHMFFAEGA